MSGVEKFTSCPKCKAGGTYLVYVDRKPCDIFFGTCLKCGFFQYREGDQYREEGQLEEEELQEMRKTEGFDPSTNEFSTTG